MQDPPCFRLKDLISVPVELVLERIESRAQPEAGLDALRAERLGMMRGVPRLSFT